MKTRSFLLILLTALILVSGIASGESSTVDSIHYDEWDWDNESVNAFSGAVDCSQWAGNELTLEIKASFEPESESSKEAVPKFTHFNGSRLTMLRQSDAMTFTPETDQGAIEYTCSLQMPEKEHYSKITIDLTVKDSTGNELKRISAAVARGGDSSSQRGNIFYIPFEIRNAALIIAAAALAVWCIAIIRNRILNKNK